MESNLIRRLIFLALGISFPIILVISLSGQSEGQIQSKLGKQRSFVTTTLDSIIIPAELEKEEKKEVFLEGGSVKGRIQLKISSPENYPTYESCFDHELKRVGCYFRSSEKDFKKRVSTVYYSKEDWYITMKFVEDSQELIIFMQRHPY